MKKAVFLDRDGVINIDHGYTHTIEEFEFYEGVFAACRRFQSLGYIIVVVTNQAGIARGYYTESDFETLTDWMLGQFKEQGVDISGVYHCPHHATEGFGEYKVACDCRKPEPGMLLAAAAELDIDLSASLIVGDKESDIEAGRNAGLKKCILISEKENETVKTQADSIAKSLVHIII